MKRLVPLVCIASPIVCYILKQHDAAKGHIGIWLGNYTIGNELLIINAGLTFLGLLLISRHATADTGKIISMGNEKVATAVLAIKTPLLYHFGHCQKY